LVWQYRGIDLAVIHMIRKFAGQPFSKCSSKVPEYYCWKWSRWSFSTRFAIKKQHV